MTDVVEKIHKAFKESFEKSEAVFDLMLAKLEKQLSETADFVQDTAIYKELASLFPESQQVKEAVKGIGQMVELSKSKSNIEIFLQELAQLRMRFSTYRIITYSQMIEILEEYNLFIGPSMMYVGEIPAKNAVEIAQFSKYLKDGFIQHSNLPTSAQDIVGFVESPVGFSDPQIPLFRKGFNKKETGSRNLYIVGQNKHFKHKNLSCVGREVFIDNDVPKFKFEDAPTPPDPIVLAPIQFTKSKLGNELKLFFVVSAWGAEAAEVANPVHN